MSSESFKFRSKIFPIFLSVLSVCILFSCKSTRQTQSKELSKKEISNLLCIKIGSHDNIFLYREAALWLKTPHVDGGSSKNGIDCSYLAYIIYMNVYQKRIERNSNDILDKNCKRISKNRLDEGDLVFFNTKKRRNGSVNHVGVYLKDGKFIHTSTSRGVIVSSLDEDYYQKTWVCGGRVK